MGDGHKLGVYFPPLNGFCNWQWMSDISHEGTDPWREEELGSSSDGPELTSSPSPESTVICEPFPLWVRGWGINPTNYLYYSQGEFKEESIKEREGRKHIEAGRTA